VTDSIDAYDKHAQSWAAARTGASFWAAARAWLKTQLPPGKRLIEFGCGPGWDGEKLAEDYDYTGLDGSRGMLSLARERLQGLPLWHMDLRTMTLPTGADPFEGFWCAAVLLHIPEEELDLVLGNMKSMLIPKGAVGFIAVKDGKGTEVCMSPDIPSPRFFQCWDREGFAAHLECCGYQVTGYEMRPSGKTSNWSWHQFLVRS
jgi:cyclopropane fatty-acyl-phospholipid synthase-like methyltransferase